MLEATARCTKWAFFRFFSLFAHVFVNLHCDLLDSIISHWFTITEITECALLLICTKKMHAHTHTHVHNVNIMQKNDRIFFFSLSFGVRFMVCTRLTHTHTHKSLYRYGGRSTSSTSRGVLSFTSYWATHLPFFPVFRWDFGESAATNCCNCQKATVLRLLSNYVNSDIVATVLLLSSSSPSMRM